MRFENVMVPDLYRLASQVPLFFLFCQLVIAVLLLQLCALFGKSDSSFQRSKETPLMLEGHLMPDLYAGYMKLPRVDITTCKGLSPLIACNVLGLAFNTYCLRASAALSLTLFPREADLLITLTRHRIRRRILLCLSRPLRLS